MKKKRLDWREIKDRLYDLWIDVSYWAMKIIFTVFIALIILIAIVMEVMILHAAFTGKINF